MRRPLRTSPDVRRIFILKIKTQKKTISTRIELRVVLTSGKTMTTLLLVMIRTVLAQKLNIIPLTPLEHMIPRNMVLQLCCALPQRSHAEMHRNIQFRHRLYVWCRKSAEDVVAEEERTRPISDLRPGNVRRTSFDVQWTSDVRIRTSTSVPDVFDVQSSFDVR